MPNLNDIPARGIAERYYGFHYAKSIGEVSQETVNKVCFNIMAIQQATGAMRTNRPIPRGEGVALSQRRARNQNASDEEWLEALHHYRNEVGLDMDESERQWFEYIQKGVIGSVVSEVLKNYTLETQPKQDSMADIPF